MGELEAQMKEGMRLSSEKPARRTTTPPPGDGEAPEKEPQETPAPAPEPEPPAATAEPPESSETMGTAVRIGVELSRATGFTSTVAGFFQRERKPKPKKGNQ